MNSTPKVILIWILILVAAVGLYSFVERSGSPAQQGLNLTDFLSKVDRHEVAEVTVRGSTLRGRLIANHSPFVVTIPEAYTAIYDRLTAAGVGVTVVPKDQNPWLGSFLVVGGLILWVAISAVILVLLVDLSRFVKRALTQSGGNPSAA